MAIPKGTTQRRVSWHSTSPVNVQGALTPTLSTQRFAALHTKSNLQGRALSQGALSDPSAPQNPPWHPRSPVHSCRDVQLSPASRLGVQTLVAEQKAVPTQERSPARPGVGAHDSPAGISGVQ